MRAFAGIDLAFAEHKRLPVCVGVHRDGRFEPLPLADLELAPPRGEGNRATLDDDALARFADATAAYLDAVEARCGVRIVRVAIDAPSAPARRGLTRRACERALDARRIACIPTPTEAGFEAIVAKARAHVAAGGPDARLPHANQLWMRVGFALFARLSVDRPCRETYPQAVAVALGAADVHKRHPEGVARQLAALARRTGWPEPADVDRLDPIAFGARHDRLDAYATAWVASLDEHQLDRLGDADDDTLWMPRPG